MKVHINPQMTQEGDYRVVFSDAPTICRPKGFTIFVKQTGACIERSTCVDCSQRLDARVRRQQQHYQRWSSIELATSILLGLIEQSANLHWHVRSRPKPEFFDAYENIIGYLRSAEADARIARKGHSWADYNPRISFRREWKACLPHFKTVERKDELGLMIARSVIRVKRALTGKVFKLSDEELAEMKREDSKPPPQ